MKINPEQTVEIQIQCIGEIVQIWVRTVAVDETVYMMKQM